ncbi:MAG: ROK family transcriptional regulator [Clostridia bacterium]|nr:ROK family transcriptional regulator [Clostridia bacterium]
MTKKIITTASIRQNNLHTVILAIHKYGPMSKRDIQAKTMLSWGSVCTMVDELERLGLIVPSGKSTGSVGRRAVYYALNTKINHIIGVDLNIMGITAVLTDLRYGILKQTFHPLTMLTYNNVIETLFTAISELIDFDEKGNVIGIGIAVQGIVDTEHGISVYLPQVSEWENVRLTELIEKKFDIKTFIMHDPDCIMVAEKMLEFQKEPDINNIALLRLDKGIGLSLAIDGVISTNGYISELGHICVNSDGPICRCGNRGCLKMYASVDGILRRYYELSGSPYDPNIDFKALALMAVEGNEICVSLFKDMSKYLGIALSTLANILPIDTFVLYGAMIQFKDLFGNEMVEHLQKHIFYKSSPINVRYSALDLNAPALGAALAVSDIVINSMNFE